jgi:hypothetical protein
MLSCPEADQTIDIRYAAEPAVFIYTMRPGEQLCEAVCSASMLAGNNGFSAYEVRRLDGSAFPAAEVR